MVVPLRKLPLNPNGKIDKPALPFPDTAQLAAAARRRPRRHLPHADGTSTPAPEGDAVTLTPIQTELREIWQSLLTLTSSPIELADNFFDLGGHSILATRMIFEVRKKFVVDVALGAIFNHPTLGALAAEIERLRGSGELSIQGIGANGASATAGTATPMPKVTASGESEYAADARELVESQLPKAYPSATTRLTHLRNHGGATVLLTGATGFLGAYILRDLLNRTSPSVAKVLVHVRAKDAATALSRVINSCLAYGVWNPAWLPRLVGVAGELGGPQIGVDDATWKMMADTVDVVIHNGALVHWVYPYRHLRPANVLGTLTLLGLCAANKEKPKSFAFVSSTSVLDTQHYVTLSDTILSAGGAGVPESDSLEGSATGLETGYGQSKWAGEYLVRKAGEAGLSGCVIRPGYVTGDSTSGVANTDDFLLRMVKGCVQLGMIPAINNTVNMVPVDHVARVVVACAFSPPGPTGSASAVAHVTSHPRLRFMRWLLMLRRYGYRVSVEDYIPWRIALEKHITANPGGEGGEENALFPLLHFVLDNLPQSTKAPELEDGNAVRALLEDGKWTKEERSAGAGVGEGVMGVYLAYLVEVGFLPGPVEVEKGVGEYGRLELPHVRLLDNQKAALGKVGGRGAA